MQTLELESFRNVYTNIQEVDKTELHLLYFPKPDVLQLQFDKNMREKDLLHARLLGNLHHAKVSILFEDIEGLKRVHTTIWGVAEDMVILKGDILLPKRRIVKVQ